MADVKGRINLLQGPAPDRLVKPKMSVLNTKLSAGWVYTLTYKHICVCVRIILTEHEAVDLRRSGKDTGGTDWREESVKENGINTIFIYEILNQ